MEQKSFIYILELEGGRWYVGLTTNPKKRLRNHSSGNATAVTKKYRFVAVHDIMEGCKDLEREVTLALMAEHGPDKVWGAAYTQTDREECFCPPGFTEYCKTLALSPYSQ